MSTVSVYASEPAFPTLAHSLLSQTSSDPGNPVHQTETETESVSLQNESVPSDNWDLKYDIDRGIRAAGTFRCGKVIGFSRLRRHGNDDDPHCVTQLPLHLLTKHLHESPESQSPSPNVFIIHPANFSAFSPKTLLAALLSPDHDPSLSQNEAIRRLDSVQLLPVYDFRSAAQAINEVSEALHKIQEERHHLASQSQSNQPASTNPVIFIIAGLDTLTEGVIRSSNPGKGAAVLTATLRTLTQLSQMYAFLSVWLVNTSGLGSVGSGSNVNAGTIAGGQSQAAGLQNEDSRQVRDDTIHSVFRQTGTPLFPSLMTRVLDQGIDTHLLISSVGNTQVVEIIKDRADGGVGKWCAWNAK